MLSIVYAECGKCALYAGCRYTECRGTKSLPLKWNPVNIRLGWKRLTVTNALTYYKVEFITAVSSFIVQVPGPTKWRMGLGREREREREFEERVR
jgi:hypothetical protein